MLPRARARVVVVVDSELVLLEINYLNVIKIQVNCEAPGTWLISQFRWEYQVQV
jgi:hypothetical protein